MSRRERLVFGTWKFPNMQLYNDEIYPEMMVSGSNAGHFKREVKTRHPKTKFVKSAGNDVQVVKTEDTKRICLWSDMVNDEVVFVSGYYFTMNPDPYKSAPNLRWMSIDEPEVSNLSESIGRKVATHLFETGEQPKQTSIQGSAKFIDWSEFVVIRDEDWMKPSDDDESGEIKWRPDGYGVPFRPSQRRVMKYHREIKQAFRELVPTALPPEPDEEPREISSGWLGLRQMLYDLCIERGIPRRDSNLVSWNLVPPEANMKRTDLLSHMMENDVIVNMKQVTFNERIRTRTRQLSNSDIGRVVERFTHRTLLGRARWCLGESSGRGHCDIASWDSCDVGDLDNIGDGFSFYALNVKFSSEPHVNRIYEVTPENEVVRAGGLAWVVLVMPKSLRMCLFPLDGSETQLLNSNKGINTTPETLADDLDRLTEENGAR